MYIGSTGVDGLHHLVSEILITAGDEAMGGHSNEIEVAILPDEKGEGGRQRLEGIPVDIHKQTGVSALETVMTTLHAGENSGGESYKISGGLHGVKRPGGQRFSWLKVEVASKRRKHVQEYKIGNLKPR